MKKSFKISTILGSVVIFVVLLVFSRFIDSGDVTPKAEDGSRQIQAVKRQKYLVTNVVDGDTINVKIDGKTEAVRLIGIDTPEFFYESNTAECFAKEAKQRAKELLSGKTVYLEKDNSQDDRDKYDRLLRYVFLTNDVNFNRLMIEEGLANEYTHIYPYKYQAEFQTAEQKAREEGKGFWGEGVCE